MMAVGACRRPRPRSSFVPRAGRSKSRAHLGQWAAASAVSRRRRAALGAEPSLVPATLFVPVVRSDDQYGIAVPFAMFQKLVDP
jgi:hypothetical protein